MDIQKSIDKLFETYVSLKDGEPAAYIPELAKANPNDFGIAVVTASGEVFKVGKTDHAFSMQSTSKPFSYGMILEDCGRAFVHSKIGVEPTGEAFNSIVELEKHTHRPFNPMINSGAIVVSGLIQGKDLAERESNVLKRLSLYLDHDLKIDHKIFESEKNTAHRNRSIAHLLRHFNVFESDIEATLDIYFKQCSILVNTVDLATMAATLANGGIQPQTKKVALKKEYVGDMLALMFTCGMYDSSGEWAYSVGIPAKSGVSGAIFGVVPGKMGIAVYSPPIDEKGNSLRGIRVFRDLSRELNLSIFR
jgi:glutaminase